MIGVRLLRESLRFLESSIRKNHYVQNTHSCSKNVVIGKQPLRSGNVEFENYEWTYVRYKVRKDVPRNKAIAEGDWKATTAK